MYVCVHTCVHVCTHVCSHMLLYVFDKGGQILPECLLLFLFTLVCERGFSQSVELALLARLAGQALETCLSPTFLRAWAVDAHKCTWVLGI